MQQPAHYIPHGAGPCFFMDWTPKGQWDPLGAYLSTLLTSAAQQPRCIVIFSAHWQCESVSISADTEHQLFYDYRGFPEHTYQFNWAPKGSVDVAQTIQGLLHAHAIPAQLTTDRGLDHGVFIPLMLADPTAAIPVVQVSLHASLDPKMHLAMGRALAELRNKAIMCIGSGLSFHNVNALRGRTPGGQAEQFASELMAAITQPSTIRDSALCDILNHPELALAHPTTEHLLPLHVIAGLSDHPGTISFIDQIAGSTIFAADFVTP